MEEYEEYVRQGLNGEAPLKLILCGIIITWFTACHWTEI